MADTPVPLLFRPLAAKAEIPSKRDMALLPDDLVDCIRQTGPDIIGFSCFSDDWPFTLWLIRRVNRVFPETPIVVGGIHATIAPDEVLKHREIMAVCIGEGEQALVELLDSHKKGRFDSSIRNFWFKVDGGIRRNTLRPPLEFNARTPFADWSIYNDNHFIYPFEGKLYRRGSVSLSRGCPFSCSFCVNDFFKSGLNSGQHRLRRKDIDYAIEELVYLKTTHRLEFLRFWDETFLAMPRKYISDFSRKYRDRIGLPFTIETTADSITRQNAGILKEMGCRSVSIGVETSNQEQRRQLLKKNITNAQYERAFKILTDIGIRKVANFMFLLPCQTVEEMYRCILLCADWQVESPSPRIFYPYKGTALRNYCFQKGLINTAMIEKLEDENRIQSLDGLSSEYMTFQDTVLRIPEKIQEQGRLLMENFVLLQETPRWMHSWIKELLSHEDKRTALMVQGLRKAVFEKRFGKGRAAS